MPHEDIAREAAVKLGHSTVDRKWVNPTTVRIIQEAISSAVEARDKEIERLRRAVAELLYQSERGYPSIEAVGVEGLHQRIAELEAENKRCYDIFKREAWLEAADKSNLEGPYAPHDEYLRAVEAKDKRIAELEGCKHTPGSTCDLIRREQALEIVRLTKAVEAARAEEQERLSKSLPEDAVWERCACLSRGLCDDRVDEGEPRRVAPESPGRS